MKEFLSFHILHNHLMPRFDGMKAAVRGGHYSIPAGKSNTIYKTLRGDIPLKNKVVPLLNTRQYTDGSSQR